MKKLIFFSFAFLLMLGISNVNAQLCSVWSTVGSAGFSGSAGWLSMAFDGGGLPYAAFQDGFSSTHAIVMRYDGSSWIAVGSGGFTTGSSSEFSLAVNGSTPYVAYTDGSLSNRIVVKKYDGNSWVDVGSPTSSNSNIASLIIDNTGMPCMAYIDGGNSRKINIARYDGTSWSPLGGTGISSAFSSNPSLTMDGSGTLYVAYTDNANSSKVTVKKYNGSTWEAVGSAASDGNVHYLSLKVSSSGTPYVAYQDGINFGWPMVKKYNGSTWETVGGTGVTAHLAMYTSLTIDASGTPYLGFMDGTYTYKLSVMKYNGSNWTYVGDGGFSTGGGDDVTLAINSSGKMYVGYRDYSFGGGSAVVQQLSVRMCSITGARTVCQGAATTLSNATGGGVWTSSDPAIASINTSGLVSGLAAGTTTISYTAGDSMATYTFTVNAVPATSASGGKIMTSGETATLTAIGATAYSWSPSAGLSASTGSSVVASPAVTTVYTLTGTANGCSSTDTETVTIATLCSDWYDVGTTASSGGSSYESIAISSSGTPYVAFEDSRNGNKATVMTFDGSSWLPVGPLGFSTNFASSESLIISPSGTPYLAYQETPNMGRTFVKAFNGTSWVTVGGTSVSTFGGWYPSFAMNSSGTPYVAFQDDNNGSRMTVKAFNGTSWAAVGDTGFSAGVASYTSITIGSDGTPYVAFKDGPSGKATAMKYDGSHWVSVGTAISASYAGDITIALDAAGTPYVAYQDQDNGNKAMLKKYDGSSWVTVGGAPISAGNAVYLTLTIGRDGTPYVAYQDGANSFKITVRKYDGTSWLTLGGAPLSSGPGQYPSLTTDASGVLHAAYSDAGNKSTIRKYAATVCPITGAGTVCAGNTIALSTASTSGIWSSDAPAVADVNTSGVVTGIAPGTATISYTVLSKTGTKIVTVNAVPAITSISNNGPLCTRDTMKLNATATGTGTINYQWTGPAGFSMTGAQLSVPMAVTAATGQYTLSISDDSHCTASTMTTSMTVYPRPGITNIANSGPKCAGQSFGVSCTVIDGTIPYSYSWVGPNGFTSTERQPFTLTATDNDSGLYTLTVTDANNCVAIGTNTTLATVHSRPAITSATNDGPICAGADLHLSGAATGVAPLLFSWSGPGISAAGPNVTVTAAPANVPGTYTLMVMDGNNCSTTAVTLATVNPQPANIHGTAEVCMGEATTLASSTTGGVWSSDNTSIAAIDAATGIATGITAGTTTISYTMGSGCYTTAPILVKQLPPNIIGVTAINKNAYTTMQDAIGGGTWSSSNTSVASISASGLVSASTTPGSTTITYTLPSGCFRTKVLSVNAAPLPDTAAACIGSTTTLNNYQGAGSWSSNNTAIATVDPATGIVTALQVGSVTLTFTPVSGTYSTRKVTISGTLGPITGTMQTCAGATTTLLPPTSSGGTWASNDLATATIGITSGVVTGNLSGTVTITYTSFTYCRVTAEVTINAPLAANTGITNTCLGSTTQLSNSRTGGTWSSSNALVGTVSATGMVGGIAPGTTTIKYVHNGCQATTIITVNTLPAAIGTIPAICAGSVATLTDATVGGTWSIAPGTGTASIDQHTGVVTGLTPGNAIVSYSLGSGCARTAAINIANSMAPISGNMSVCVGATSALTIAASGGIWTSSTPAVASVVSGNGMVTGVASGTTTITYAIVSGCKTTSVITVNTAPGAITGTASICAEATTALSSTGSGAWSSSNPVIGTVDVNSGVVTGMSGGTVVITRTGTTGCTKTLSVTVKALPAVITGTAMTCTGSTTTLICTGSTGTWASSTSGVASIGVTSGVVTPASAGTTTITFTAMTSGCRRTRVVTVNATASAGTLSGPSTVIIGNTIQLTSDGVAGGTWSSTALPIAIVNTTSGVVTGISAGAATIRYTVNNGCGNATSTFPITVTTSRPGGNTASIDEDARINIYPNPTTGSITVKSGTAGMLTVYTSDGKEVIRYELQAGTTMLNLPYQLASGMYLCRYTGTDGDTEVTRIVLQR